MYYIYFPIYLLLLYSATYLIPKAPPPPVEIAATAPQAEREKKSLVRQSPIGERSPMMAPSEPVERKETVKESAAVEQREEPNVAMAAPSEVIEEKEEVKKATLEVKHELGQESNIAMATPSEPVDRTEGVREEASKQETKPEQNQESGIAIAAPSEPVGKKEDIKGVASDVTRETQPEGKQETSTKPLENEENIEEVAANGKEVSETVDTSVKTVEREENTKEINPEKETKPTQDSAIVMTASSKPEEDTAEKENQNAVSESKHETEQGQELGKANELSVKEKLAKLKEEFTFEDINFEPGRYNIRGKDRDALNKLAEWLMKHKEVKLVVEGHSDERGTAKGNMALGRIRADSVRKYIINRGVNAERISLISYGKEAPLCLEPNEKCWGRNRRVSFNIEFNYQ